MLSADSLETSPDISSPQASTLIEPSPRQAAGNLLPGTAVLRSPVRMKIDSPFARYPRRKRRGMRSLSRFSSVATTWTATTTSTTPAT